MATVQKLRDVTPEQLVQRAVDLRPMIADSAPDNEKNRRLHRLSSIPSGKTISSGIINPKNSAALNTISQLRPCNA